MNKPVNKTKTVTDAGGQPSQCAPQTGGRGVKIAGGLLGLVALMAASGCHALNESDMMRGADPIPAFASNPPVKFTGGQTLTGIDRSDWPVVTVHVSANDSENQATYGTWRLLNDHPIRRDAGGYPDVESALDIPDSPKDVEAQYAELFFAPVHQLLNIALIPYFVLTDKPLGTTEYGPSHPYQRELPITEDEVQLTADK